MKTILDVAKMAGVSKSTVSRVLSGGSVKPQTRKKITDAMESLHYVPSYFAQGIRTRRTKTLAMLVPDSANLFYIEIYRGAEKAAIENGYMVILCSTEGDPAKEIEIAQKLAARSIDGILYYTYEMNRKNVDFFLELSLHKPVVFMDYAFSQFKGISFVATDGYSGTKEAVKFLARKGRKKIAYIRMSKQVGVLGPRYDGYADGLLELSLPHRREWIYEPSINDAADYLKVGEDAARYFLSLDDRPDAIIAATDLLAIGVIKGLQKAGAAVPRDFAIVGFDNLSLSKIIEPDVTTIAQPLDLIGRTAAMLLIGKLKGETIVNERVVYLGKLIERRST